MSYSAIAWALANTAQFEATDGGGVRAFITLQPWRQRVVGVGATSSEAARDLAQGLDRWSERLGPITRGET